MSPLQEIIDKFQMADEEMRLELLLDFSRKLPPIPAELAAQRDAGLNRVHECMSPVFLWVDREGDAVRIAADVADEAPTIKGLLAIIVAAFDGQSPAMLANVPPDLLHRLGLSGQIRMNRAVGVGAIIGRIRRRGDEILSEKVRPHSSSAEQGEEEST